jgi:hypothetical protein
MLLCFQYYEVYYTFLAAVVVAATTTTTSSNNDHRHYFHPWIRSYGLFRHRNIAIAFEDIVVVVVI